MNDKQVYILGGYQTDFARNWARENKHISAMMREAYGENVPPPESSAYLLCCTAIATSSVKFGSLPKLLFNLETKDLALADRWAEVPEKFMALPYVMTIIT